MSERRRRKFINTLEFFLGRNPMYTRKELTRRTFHQEGYYSFRYSLFINRKKRKNTHINQSISLLHNLLLKREREEQSKAKYHQTSIAASG
jgi:hypothetical protein